MTHHTYRHFLAALITTGVLAGCGGGGGGGGSTPTTLSGAVIDGYLKGAVVCLDVNANLKCDGASEYQTRSGDNGAYVLNVPVGVDISKYHVLAEVGTDAIDSDTNAAPAKAYNLLAPAVDAAVVTPLTTFVSHTLMTGTGATLDEAKAQVLINFNLPSTTKLNQDYVASSDGKAHRVAKLAAAVLGQVKTDVLTAITPTTEAQKTLLFKEVMKQAQTTLTTYSIAAQASDDAGFTTIQNTALADATSQVRTNQDNIEKQSALEKSTSASLQDLLRTGGLFDVWRDYTTNTQGAVLEAVRYSRMSSVDGVTVMFERYFSPKLNPAWGLNGNRYSNNVPSATSAATSPAASNTSVSYSASEASTTWVDNTDIGAATWTPASEIGAGTLTFNKSGLSYKISTTVLDVSGKKASQLPYMLGNQDAYCGWNTQTNSATVCPDWQDFTFSSGAQIVDGTSYRNQNQYSVTDCTLCGISGGTGLYKTLDEMIANASGATLSNMLWGVTKIPLVLSKVTDNYGTVSFRSWKNSVNGFAEVGKGRYDISTVAGKRVLTIQVISEETPGTLVAPYEGARAEYAVNVIDNRVIFVEWGGKILGGHLYLKGQASTSRTRPSLNRVAADDLLRVQGYLQTK